MAHGLRRGFFVGGGLWRERIFRAELRRELLAEAGARPASTGSFDCARLAPRFAQDDSP